MGKKKRRQKNMSNATDLGDSMFTMKAAIEDKGVAFDKADIQKMLSDAGMMESPDEGKSFSLPKESPAPAPDNGQISRNIAAVMNNVDKVVPEKKEEPKKEESPEEPPKFEFKKEDIQQAVLHFIKPMRSQFSKEYRIYPEFSVWFRPIKDKHERVLNEYSREVLSDGDIRTRVDVRESYYDEMAQTTVPGGRTETKYYYNPDAQRAVKRAEMAMYIARIDEIDFKEDTPLATRLEILEDYPSVILDVVYEKGFLHFLSLMLEAKKEIGNFYPTLS
jgi:hypothetical protein